MQVLTGKDEPPSIYLFWLKVDQANAIMVMAPILIDPCMDVSMVGTENWNDVGHRG
jgi:hypothetical protein